MKDQEYQIVGEVRTTITYLEMYAKPNNLLIPEVDTSVSLQIENHINISLYRELYHKVGASLTWTRRKLMSDQELSEMIHSPNTTLFVLRKAEDPIGFIEFEKKVNSNEVEIRFFGIIPEFYGQKLGIYLLNSGINYIWNIISPKRLWLRTCDLDHKNALNVYLRSGFTVEKTENDYCVKLIEPVQNTISAVSIGL